MGGGGAPHSDLYVQSEPVAPWNLDLGISSQLGRVYTHRTFSWAFSPIPFDDLSTRSLLNRVFSGSTMLSLDSL